MSDDTCAGDYRPGWMICCSSFRLDDPLHGDVTDECPLDIDIRLAAPVPHKDFYRTAPDQLLFELGYGCGGLNNLQSVPLDVQTWYDLEFKSLGFHDQVLFELEYTYLLKHN